MLLPRRVVCTCGTSCDARNVSIYYNRRGIHGRIWKQQNQHQIKWNIMIIIDTVTLEIQQKIRFKRARLPWCHVLVRVIVVGRSISWLLA